HMVKNSCGCAVRIIPSSLRSLSLALVARDQSKCNASAAGDRCASVVRQTCLMPSLTLRQAVSLFETGYPPRTRGTVGGLMTMLRPRGRLQTAMDCARVVLGDLHKYARQDRHRQRSHNPKGIRDCASTSTRCSMKCSNDSSGISGSHIGLSSGNLGSAMRALR